ncbi:hypothetical protein Pfo_003569 [Paulownia fortunei]|nr:hypothetical protein Pfo_003569 [Paulownia fortunei]
MRILRFLFLVFFLGLNALMATGFTGTYGINYGRIADNILHLTKLLHYLRLQRSRMSGSMMQITVFSMPLKGLGLS